MVLDAQALADASPGREDGRLKDLQRRVAVFLPNWLGDVLMAFPSLSRFHHIFPETEIHIVCREAFWELLSWQGFAAQVHPIDGAGWRRFRRAANLSQLCLDAAIILPNSFRSGVEARLSQAKRRVGYKGEGRSLLLTHSIKGKGDPSLHQSERYAVLFRLAGMEGEVSFPQVAVPEDVARGVREQFLGPDTRQTQGYMVVSPGAGFGKTKRWPAERFAETCRALLDGTVDRVVVVGTAAEDPLCRQVVSSLEESHPGGAINAAGMTHVADLACLLSGAVLCLANDSGPMHLAAGLGVPTVGIFLSTSPQVSRPLGERVAWVTSSVTCRPCFRSSCPTGTWECLDSVEAGAVLEGVVEVLGKSQRR